MKYHKHVEISVYTNNPFADTTKKPPVKVCSTIVFEHEDEIAKAEAFLQSVYGWKKGFHYVDLVVTTIREEGEKLGVPTTTHIDFGVPYQEPNTSPSYARKILNQLNQENTMAKKAEKTETTEVALFEEKAKGINLPEIPEVINIGGIDVSDKEIQKAVDEVKKITVDIPKKDDTVEVAEQKKLVYQDLVEKKNKFVKTRTSAEKFYKELSAPVSAWVKKLKARTDGFGTIARQGQEHCESQIYIWENWEEEQLRIQQQAKQKLVEARTADLQSVQGIINRDSLHWTFPHLPSKIVENLFLEEADDSEWNGLMKELEDSFKQEQMRVEKERELLVAAQQAVFNARVQILQLMQYEAVGDSFSKNGHIVTPEQIKSLTDAEWMPFLMSHNTPAQNVNPFASVQPQAEDAFASPGDFATNQGTTVYVMDNPFGTPFGISEPENINTAQIIEEQEVTPNVLSIGDVSAYLFGDNKWEDKVVSDKSSVRLFDQRHRDEAAEGLSLTYEAKFDNGLGLFIYKNSK